MRLIDFNTRAPVLLNLLNSIKHEHSRKILYLFNLSLDIFKDRMAKSCDVGLQKIVNLGKYMKLLTSFIYSKK